MKRGATGLPHYASEDPDACVVAQAGRATKHPGRSTGINARETAAFPPTR